MVFYFVPSMCVAIELDPTLHTQMDYCRHLSVQIGQAMSEEKFEIIMRELCGKFHHGKFWYHNCEFFNYTAPEEQSRSIGSWKQNYYD